MAVKKSSTRTSGGTKATKSTAPTTTPESLLVCLQDPFPVGTWIHSETAHIPCADGLAKHLWEVRTGFELLAPRILEGQASRLPVTLALKAHFQAAPAQNGTWASSVHMESPTTNPLRVTLRWNAAGRIETSLAYAALRAPERRLAATNDKRWFYGDIAFVGNGDSGVTVGAVAVIATRAWSNLLSGSNAIVKGLAFDGGWRRNLEEGPEPPADGAGTAIGSWAFATMEEQEYLAWCTSTGRTPSIAG